MRSNRRLFWLSFFVAAVAVLVGWSAVESGNDLRTCELSIGAINNANAKINIQRVTSSTFSRVIRIDYNVSFPNRRQPIDRFVVCRFSSERIPPFKTGLASLNTEFGPLPDSNLFMLKRFYLETSEAHAVKIPNTPDSSAGLAGFTVRLTEWLLSIAAKASLLTLMALVFLAILRLFPALPPSMFYGIAGSMAAALGAWAITGNISRIAPVLAITAGIVNGGCSLVLYAETATRRTKAASPRLLPWILLALFIALALFWFPDRGFFGRHWLPEALFQPLTLFTVTGYGISAKPLSLILIFLAAITVAFKILPSPNEWTLAPFPGTPSAGITGFLAFMAVTGIISALGYLHFGMAANPLLLGTKALLIALISLMATGLAQRLHVLLLALTVVSLEYALAPYLAETLVDTVSYVLLALAMLLWRGGGKIPERSNDSTPDLSES